MDLQKEMKGFRCVWRGEIRGFVEHEPRVSFSMGKEMYGFACGNVTQRDLYGFAVEVQ